MKILSLIKAYFNEHENITRKIQIVMNFAHEMNRKTSKAKKKIYVKVL